MSAELALKAIQKSWASLSQSGEVFCAVSGGLDSMVLLHAVARHREWFDRAKRVSVLHVNHNLRGEESLADEALVKAAAASFGLDFRATLLDWEGEHPSQAACRERRFTFFQSALPPGAKVFLAHHQDDQAETILLRLLRGTGLRGLRGMSEENGVYLRPFLGLGRKDLEAAALEWKVPWREDASNQNPKYERNWLRLEILPLLEARRPGVNSRLAALAQEIKELPLGPDQLDFFESGKRWRLYRREDLNLSAAELSHHFALSRLHTGGMQDLLRKNSGSYAAAKRMQLSANFLLVGEAKELALPGQAEQGENGRILRSALGEWSLHASEDPAGFAPALKLGTSAKKEFQRERVPRFLRGQVPLLLQKGRPWALLPSRLARLPEVKYSPSALAKWWLKI